MKMLSKFQGNKLKIKMAKEYEQDTIDRPYTTEARKYS